MFSKKTILIVAVLILLFSIGSIAYALKRDIGGRYSECTRNSDGTYTCECQVKKGFTKGNTVDNCELGKLVTDSICACCGDCTLANFLELGVNISSIILKYLGVFALLMFMIGGVIWITSGGSSEKVQLGKKIISGAVVGMVIVLGSVLIVRVVGDMFGVEEEYLRLEVPGTGVTLEKPERPGLGFEDVELGGEDLAWDVCVYPEQNDLFTWWCFGCTIHQVNPPQGCEGNLVKNYIASLEGLGYYDCWGMSETKFDNFTQACTQDFQKDYNSGKWNNNNPPAKLLRDGSEDGLVDADTYLAVVTGPDIALVQLREEPWQECTTPPTTWDTWSYNANTLKGCKDGEGTDNVRNYETALNGWGFNCGMPDEKFDEVTKGCTRRFQRTISYLQPFYLQTDATVPIIISGEVDLNTYEAYSGYYYDMLRYVDGYITGLDRYGCDCDEAFNIGQPPEASKLTNCTKSFQETINDLQPLWTNEDAEATGIRDSLSLNENGIVDESTLRMSINAAGVFKRFSQKYGTETYLFIHLLPYVTEYSYALSCGIHESELFGSYWTDWPASSNSNDWPKCPNPEDAPKCYGCFTVNVNFIGCQSTGTKTYQTRLNTLGCNCGPEDGKFGSQSEECTRKFQNTMNYIGPTLAVNDRWYESNNEFTKLEVTGMVDEHTNTVYWNEGYLTDVEWLKENRSDVYDGAKSCASNGDCCDLP